jgi:hypothetical protein
MSSRLTSPAGGHRRARRDRSVSDVFHSFEAIARHFGTARPNVHGKIKTLERPGLLTRSPGVARSLRVLVLGQGQRISASM